LTSEKKQKDFYKWGQETAVAALPQAQHNKSLLLVFFKKEESSLT